MLAFRRCPPSGTAGALSEVDNHLSVGCSVVLAHGFVHFGALQVPVGHAVLVVAHRRLQLTLLCRPSQPAVPRRTQMRHPDLKVPRAHIGAPCRPCLRQSRSQLPCGSSARSRGVPERLRPSLLWPAHCKPSCKNRGRGAQNSSNFRNIPRVEIEHSSYTKACVRTTLVAPSLPASCVRGER